MSATDPCLPDGVEVLQKMPPYATSRFCWSLLGLFLVVCSFGLGYQYRVHEERKNPVTIQQIKQMDRDKHLKRFRAAAAAVADSAHLKPGMDTTIYVFLVQNLQHPCPLPDPDLQFQCRKLLQVAQAMRVVEEKPR